MSPREDVSTGGNGQAANIAVHLIGGFEFRSPREVVLSDRRKACALIAYLVCSPAMRETRGRLAALLWSDSDEERARSSLRQTVRDLRKMEEACGAEFLRVDKLNVGLAAGAVESDLQIVRRALAQRDFQTVETMLAGGKLDICAGLEDCDPAFETWAKMQSIAFSDALLEQLSKELSRPDLTRGERRLIAACLLHVDPFHDAAVIEMMTALYRDDGFARAGAFYRNYAADLRRELDLTPPPHVAESFNGLTHSENGKPAPARMAAGSRAPEAPDWPKIALVTARSANQEDYLQVALVSEICAAFSRFRHWTAVQVVVDDHAVRVGDAAAVVQACGGQTDLALLITRKASDEQFDITCLDLQSGERRFSMDVPLDHRGWPSIFNTISAQVASRLQTAISSARLLRIDRLSPNYGTAYDSWLDGQRLSILWKKETEAQAITRYEEAIRRDPGFACAYSSLAAVLNSRWIVLPGYPVESADLERAFELSRTAVALDPIDHRNHVNLAWSHLLAKRWELADFHFGLAYRLNAANPATLIAYALASSFMGEHARARELVERAMELHPAHETHYHGYRSTILFFAGDHAGCIDAVGRSGDLFPDIHGWSAAANMCLGNSKDGAAEFRTFLRQVSAAWYDGSRPSRQAAIAWFKSVFPLRRDADREQLATAIDRAAALDMATRP